MLFKKIKWPKVFKFTKKIITEDSTERIITNDIPYIYLQI